MVRLRRSRVLLLAFVLPPVALAVGMGACAAGTSDDPAGLARDSGSSADGQSGGDATTGSDGAIDGAPGLDAGPDSAVSDAGAPSDAQAEADAGPVYCAPAAAYDAGEAGVIHPSPQVFSAQMAGCPGTVFWSDRATLCGPACAPCGAAEWVAQRGSIAPAYDYWTNDNLGYSGEFSAGLACFAYPLDGGPDAAVPYACSSTYDDAAVTTPMRVCTDDPSDAPFTYGQPDPLGNVCNWSRCAYGTDASVPDAGPDAAPPSFDYLGGCDDNLTAGTLCCCP